MQEDASLPQVKQERDCDLNLKVEVNIRSETGPTGECTRNIIPFVSVSVLTIGVNIGSVVDKQHLLACGIIKSMLYLLFSLVLTDPSLLSSPYAAQEPSEEADSSDRLNVSQCSPTEDTVDLTCRPKPKGQPKSSNPSTGPDPKLETQPDCAVQLPPPPIETEPSPERLNSLGLDLAWMQERVSHLGADRKSTRLNSSHL